MRMDKELFNALLRRDFYMFVQRVFREIKSGETFEESWAVEAICYALSEVAAGRRRRQIIAVPPRSLKSVCTVALSAWMLGHDPTTKIIAVSYSQELADRFSAECRQVMKSAWYRELFPRTAISPFKDRESYFRTTAGGFRDATSVGGTLTGKGGNVIIIDDPAKPDEVMSPTQREAINGWYGRTLVSRLDNKLTGRMLIVMQRLHLDDLVGHATQFEPWDMLALAAIAQQPERVQIGLNRFHDRQVGEVLRPDSEPNEILDRFRHTLGNHAFSAQYQQQPVPSDGEVVRLDWFMPYAAAPEYPRAKIVQSWDTAMKFAENNDYSVCVTAAVMRDKVYILDIYRAKLDFPSLKKVVVERALRFKAEVLIIEDNGSGTALRQQLKEERIYGLPDPTAYIPKGEKEMRMKTVSHIVERGDVFLPEDAPWKKPFLEEILQFPEGKHDDQVDAFSQLLDWNNKRLHHGAKIETRGMFH